MTGFTGWHRYPDGHEELFENGRPVRRVVSDRRRESDLTIRKSQ